MNDKVLDKIHQFRQLAEKSPVKSNQKKVAGTFQTNDGLTKAIRNPHEAAIFLNELNAVVKAATGR